MPLYDFRCAGGHRFEAQTAMADPAPPCPACGRGSAKVPSPVSFGGRAGAGVPPESMPQTWRGTYHGNREYIASLQRRLAQRERLVERYPELAGDRRPVLAHEGRYAAAPLRAGEPAPPGTAPPGTTPPGTAPPGTAPPGPRR